MLPDDFEQEIRDAIAPHNYPTNFPEFYDLSEFLSSLSLQTDTTVVRLIALTDAPAMLLNAEAATLVIGPDNAEAVVASGRRVVRGRRTLLPTALQHR